MSHVTPRMPVPIVRPLREFLRTEAAGGLLLLSAAAAALVWANVAPGGNYADFWARQLSIGIAGRALDLSLHDWVNDALMAVFFLVVGLEIKREVLQGELNDRRRAALPVAAAIGGMAIPALIYVAINARGGELDGWGVPMATDIAFAVGVLALLGRQAPLSLKVFLLALAIVDDIGAIAVIALFYSEGIDFEWLAAAAAILGAVFVLGLLGVRALVLYAALGIAAWLAVHESGVHATIAGVALGLLLPIAPSAGTNDHGEKDVARDEAGAASRGSVVERLEHVLHPWTSYLIVPVFALANAGVDLRGGAAADAVTSQVSLGVAAGLVVGKPLGILLFSMLAVRLGVASLPRQVTWPHVAGAGLVAGIGFTVSLFIAGLAFETPTVVDEAKIGILAASAIAGVLGCAALWVLPGER